MSLIMSIDVETTGIDLTGEDKSKVISLGAVIGEHELEVFRDIFGETQPRDITWNSKALQMNLGTLQRIQELSKKGPNQIPGYSGVTTYLVSTYEAMAKVLWGFISFNLRETPSGTKVVLLGKNLALFDIPMLGDTLLNIVGEGGLDYKAIDIGNLYLRPEDNGKVPCLDECVKRAGGMSPVPHTALGDAKLVMELYRQWYVAH